MCKNKVYEPFARKKNHKAVKLYEQGKKKSHT